MDNMNCINNEFSVIAIELGALTESIIKRIPPYDSIPIIPEASSYYLLKYLKYFDEITPSFKEEIIESICGKAKWNFFNRLSPKEENPIDIKKYESYDQSEQKFLKWVELKEEHIPPQKLYIPFKEEIKVNSIIRERVRANLPEFLYNNNLSSSDTMVFSKSWLDENSINLFVGRGSRRLFLNFMVGINRPYFFVDIANFFSWNQSYFKYHTSEELSNAVNRAISLVEKLLPFFIERMEKVITHGAGGGQLP